MTSHQFLLDAQRAAHAAHFVLEEHAQRLHDLEVHLLGQTAHVVVALDLGGDAFDARTLDHIRIDGPLGQPAGVFYFFGVFVKGFDEEAADDLALGFRLRDAGECRQEILGGVGADHVEAHVLVGGQHVFELVLPQQAVVHEDAGELAADGLVEQHAGYGGIHATAQAQDHALVPDLLPECLDRRLDERVRGPVAGAAADVQCEVGQHAGTLDRVVHLRMELHREGGFAREIKSSVHDIGRGGDDAGTGRQRGNAVTVRHPDLRFGGNALQQRGFRHHFQHGAAILAGVGSFHFATSSMGHVLGAVADAQQRELAAETRQVGLRCVRIAH